MRKFVEPDVADNPLYHKSTVHFGLTILCGTNTSIATFELTLTPSEEHENRRNLK